MVDVLAALAKQSLADRRSQAELGNECNPASRIPHPVIEVPMHTIRLRGPWDFRVLEDHARPDVSDAELPSGRIKMPTDWGASLGRDFRGRVCYTRRFNQPTGLDDAAQVRLCVGAVDGLATISLNDELLGQMRGDQTKQWFDVKPLLRPANQLEITVEFPVNLDPTLRPAGRDNAVGGLIGDVSLEILEAN